MNFLRMNLNIKNFTYGWFIFSIFFIIVLASLQGYFEYNKAIQNTKVSTKNLTVLLTKKFENDFDQAKNILKLAEYVIKTLPSENSNFSKASFKEKQEIVSDKFKFLIKSFQDVSVINFANKNGDIIYSSNILKDKINTSNREYFQALKNNKDLDITFSNVIFSLTSNSESIVQAKAIRDEKGELIGVLTALIDIKTINKTLKAIKTGEKGVVLLRNSDTSALIARYPQNEGAEINGRLPDSNATVKKIKDGEKKGSLEYIASTDKEKRLGSFLLMEKYPFYVQSAISEKNYLDQWKKNSLIVAILTTLFIIGSFLLFRIMKMNYLKELSLLKELKLVKNRFENMFKIHSSIMLLINPKTGQIIDANKSAVDFYGYSLDELRDMNISKINHLSLDEIKAKYSSASKLKENKFSFYHTLKNGEKRSVEIHSSPIETKSGTILFSIIKDITKEQELENELLSKKIRFETFVKLSSDAIFIMDTIDGKILEYSQQTKKDLGYSDIEMQNLSILDLDKDLNNIEQYRKMISKINYNKPTSIERVHKRKDSSLYDVAINFVKIKLDEHDYIYCSAKDITNEKIMQNKLRESYQNLEKLIETQANIMILTDGEELKFANRKFFDFFNFKDLEEFKKFHKCICEFFIENNKFFHLKKIDEDANWLQEINLLEESKRIVLMAKNGQEFAFSVSINNYDNDTMIVNFTDISQTVTEKITLEKKILHDKLTNAYNREFFDQNYRRLIEEYNTSNSKLAIALLDIDHFKHVNDTYGHDIGDKVLIQFVDTLHKNSRKSDILVRWGGEEFIMILKIDEASNLKKILESLRESIELFTFDTVGNKTCSIGGTIYLENEDILKTVKRADEAVYKAKELGRNQVVIY